VAADQPALRRNDFAWHAGPQARRWGADLIYTWTGQAAVLALLRGLPVAFEAHDLPGGRVGPLWYRLFFWRLPGASGCCPSPARCASGWKRALARSPRATWSSRPTGWTWSSTRRAARKTPASAGRELGLPEAGDGAVRRPPLRRARRGPVINIVKIVKRKHN
jgi:hypothetical protein